MKINLTALQHKLANGDFVGFTIGGFTRAEDDCKPAAEKACNVKLGAAKLAPTKLGATKAGLSRD